MFVQLPTHHGFSSKTMCIDNVCVHARASVCVTSICASAAYTTEDEALSTN